MTVYSFPAKSTWKVARHMEMCMDIKANGYMGVFNPRVFQKEKYKWVYYVVEWVLDDMEIDYVNSSPKPLIPASYWVKFLSRNYRYEVVHHEVPYYTYTAPKVDYKLGDFDFFAVSYSLIRKTPYVLITWANNTRHKGVIFADKMVCLQIHNPNVKCMDFGVQDEALLRYMYEHAKTYVFLSGDEGFGLPPLEATYFRRPVIAYPIMPFLEWHERDSFTIPDKYVKLDGVYQDGTLHPVALPTDLESVVKFVEDMVGKEPDEKTLKTIERVRTEYVNCYQYNKIKALLHKYGIY